MYEVPPNGQGIAALLALNILKEMGVTEHGINPKTAPMNEREKAFYWHRLIEALRLAFADTRWYCADPDKVHVPLKELLGRAYAAERAQLFDPTRYTSITTTTTTVLSPGYFLWITVGFLEKLSLVYLGEGDAV